MEKQNKRQQWLDKRYGEVIEQNGIETENPSKSIGKNSKFDAIIDIKNRRLVEQDGIETKKQSKSVGKNKKYAVIDIKNRKLVEQEEEEDLTDVGQKPNTSLQRPIHTDDGKLRGHAMRSNWKDTTEIPHPTKKDTTQTIHNSPMVAVMWVEDCNEIEKFITEHKSTMDKLYKKYGVIKFTEGKCVKFNPHRQERVYVSSPTYPDKIEVDGIVAKPYVPSGKKKDVSENIKLDFLRLTRHNFGTYDPTRKEDNSAEAESFIKTLKKKLIPEIILDDKRYTDMSYDDKWTNDKIRLRAHNINYFTNQKDFKKAATLASVGRNPGEVESSSMSRQYLENSPFMKWDPTKKAKQEYLGVTPRRKQDKVGLSMKEYNVLMKGDFELNGEKIGENEFRWSLNYQLSFAKKRPDDFQIGQEKLEVIPESEIFLTNVVKISPDKRFDDRNTIAQDVEIMQGLQEIYSDFKSKLLQLDPRVLLKLSNISRIDIETVNESVYKKVMFNLLKESIKK